MDKGFTLDVGQANKIKLAARRAGATENDITRLCRGKMLAKILPVLRGLAAVNIIEHCINFDASPTVPEGFEVVEHIKAGQLKFDSTKIILMTPKTEFNGVIFGKPYQDQIKELSKRRKIIACNANLLDFYLANPLIIPDEWKGKSIVFWGTIYENWSGRYVRCLVWNGKRWVETWGCLDGWFGKKTPAAVLVNE